MNTVDLELSGECHLTALTDGSVAVVGQQGHQWLLKRFNMDNKIEMYTEELEEVPDGLSEIQVGGRPVLAVSYL